MNSEVDRLIELVVRPLADNSELRLVAEAELRKSIEAHEADRPGAAAEAADSLARADLHPHRGRWRIALYLLTLLVSLPLISHTVRQVVQSSVVGKMATSLFSYVAVPGKIPNLHPAQQLLLYGDARAGTGSARWRSLWESEPENPAYLAEYAGSYFKEHKNLSPEILAAAENIDPDNGWFLAFAAATDADTAVKREKRSTQQVKAGEAAIMTIMNEKQLEEALALIHQLAAKPRFTSYQADLLRQRIPLFAPRKDFVSQIPLLGYVAALPAHGISFRKLADILAAGAQQSAAKGDVEGFRRIVGDWRGLVTASAKGGTTMVDLLVAKVTMLGPAANFRDAARTLGLEEEARYFADLVEFSKADKDAREQRRPAEGAKEESFRKKSSILGGLTGPMLGRQVLSPPPYSAEDMLPARYADHALFGRAFSGLGWTLIGLGVVAVACVRYNKSKLTGGLFRRMTDLLSPRDWVLLVLGGVVFPVFWYLSITRLTPLTARDWSVTFMNFIPLGGQFGSFLLSLLILPTVIASRILAKRGAVFGLTPRFPWLGWLAAAAALAGVPVFGAVSLYAGAGNLLFALALLPLCSMLAWVLSGFAFGQGSHELRRAALGRIVLPVWVSGMLALALLIPFHYAEERRWIQRDRVGEISVDAPAMSRYEYDVTQIMRQELLEMIGQSQIIK
jgi:hypothetical protein